jgi:hypothetical protein
MPYTFHHSSTPPLPRHRLRLLTPSRIKSQNTCQFGLAVCFSVTTACHALSEIGLNFEQFLNALALGGTAFNSRIGYVHTDMVFNDFSDQTAYRTARPDHDMQHPYATLLVFECPFGHFYLAAGASNPVQKLGLLSDRMRHFSNECSLKVDDVTLRGQHFAELPPTGPYTRDHSQRNTRR